MYVIELSPEAGRRRDPRIPWVYVGSSARDPEIRFDQHRRGYRSSGLVKRFALRLRPDLYDDLAPFSGSVGAREAELARARELAALRLRRPQRRHLLRQGRRRLDRVGRSAGSSRSAPTSTPPRGELFESAFEPLSVDQCARLLYGEHGFWVRDHIDQDDPPPAYGMFAHVQPRP